MTETITIVKNPEKELEEKIKELKELFKANDRNYWKIAQIVSQIPELYYPKVAEELQLSKRTLYAYKQVVQLTAQMERLTSTEEMEYLKNKLPFSFFYEVARLEPSKALELLRKACLEKWNQHSLRVMVSALKSASKSLISEEIRFREEASKLPEEDVKRIYANVQIILQTLHKYNAFPKVQRYLVNFLTRLITNENEIPRTISFNEKLIPKILERKKTTTIREEKLCEVGELVTLKSKEFYAIAKIVNIYSKKLGELSDEEVQKDGFNNIEELKEFWRKELKKKWDEDRLVWIIEFQLL
jgi:uncharacterized protein YqfB (UPF0267 family)